MSYLRGAHPGSTCLEAEVRKAVLQVRDKIRVSCIEVPAKDAGLPWRAAVAHPFELLSTMWRVLCGEVLPPPGYVFRLLMWGDGRRMQLPGKSAVLYVPMWPPP
eukprot:gene8273-7602_t